MLLYNSLILTLINYCNLIWASNYKTSLNKIYLLQKRALKLCSGTKTKSKSYFLCKASIYSKSNKNIFKETNKQSVYAINKTQIAKFIYQAINKLAPDCFQNMFSTTSMIHSHNTRSEQRHDLFHKHAKSNCRKFATSLKGPEIWNNIPVTIRQLNTVSKFTKSVKRHYMQLIDN